MPVTFHKMHGLGNDFVLLDLRRQGFQLDAETARRLAERNTGVGCDQVLVLKHPAEDGQLASFEVWNADGSRAEQCGNGVRCLGLYLKMCDEAPAGPFALGGPVGEVIVECQGDGLVQVDMGRPVFEPSAIPLDLEPVDGWYKLDTTQGQVRIGAASMGNPHALLLVDDVETADVASLGSAVSTHPAFPQGCNAGFAQVLDRGHIRLRVYERGAGETRACGSGACAAVAVLHRAGMVENTVQVTQKGGNLLISWPGGKKKVIMTGDATHVFRGKLA